MMCLFPMDPSHASTDHTAGPLEGLTARPSRRHALHRLGFLQQDAVDEARLGQIEQQHSILQPVHLGHRLVPQPRRLGAVVLSGCGGVRGEAQRVKAATGHECSSDVLATHQMGRAVP